MQRRLHAWYESWNFPSAFLISLIIGSRFAPEAESFHVKIKRWIKPMPNCWLEIQKGERILEHIVVLMRDVAKSKSPMQPILRVGSTPRASPIDFYTSPEQNFVASPRTAVGRVKPSREGPLAIPSETITF